MRNGSALRALIFKLLPAAAFAAWAAYALYHYTAQFRPIGRVIKSKWFS